MTIAKKTYLHIASLLLIAGCASMHTDKSDTDNSCADGSCLVQEAKEEAFSKDEYVDYTEVAADYKAYGERTPLDHRVGTSGPASNLSSSIPPVLEEEVALYEETIDGLEKPQEEVIEETQEIKTQTASKEAVEDPVEDWLAEEGTTLKDLLSQWSQKSGWRLIWKTNRNYTLTAGAMFRARYADAASALVRAFARAKPAPIATFYKGNRVLVIETMEDENAYE